MAASSYERKHSRSVFPLSCHNYAYHDSFCHGLHSCAYGRRISEDAAVRKRAVSSYPEPDYFLRVHNQSRIATVIWAVVLFGAVSAFAIILNLIAG